MAEVYIQARVAVERGYRRPLTLATLAHSLAVSPRQLERAYDEIGLTTFAAHLRAVRLRNAAELLARQPLTVTDVARLVGYRQPSHFVKAFRRRFGVTPGAFRDAARNDATVVAATVHAGRPQAGADSRARSSRRPRIRISLAFALAGRTEDGRPVRASDSFSYLRRRIASRPSPAGVLAPSEVAEQRASLEEAGRASR